MEKFLIDKFINDFRKEINSIEEITEFNSLFDWWKITEQDDSVWKLIFDTLEK